MSTLEVNKIVGAVLTAAVVAMMAGFIAEIVYHREAPEEHAYEVAVGEGAGPGEAAAPVEKAVEPVAPLLAAADPAEGEQVAKKCATCHTFDEGGANKIGPNLYGVVGRAVASHEGFSYSSALQEESDQTWSYENLNAFLAKPKDWAAGTKMAFAGLRKVEDRADLIGYLRTLSDSPPPLPEAGAAEPAAEPAEAAMEAPEAAMETPEPAMQQPAEAAMERAGAMATGDLGEMIAAASAAQGKKVARKCAACHSFEEGGPNKIGPNLYGVVGRAVASHEGFKYSSALKDKSGETWTYENLVAFLTKPKDWAPGTKMTFPGLRKPEERAALLAYLREMSDAPPPLPQ